MYEGKARILVENRDARRIVASAARISTTQGTALTVYERSGDGEKDIRLIRKVLSSGHKSVLEHQNVSIAFDNVSVLAEQFMIEHRLASYTVKSRRYVDHAGAGYVIPDGMDGALKEAYCAGMDRLFALYAKLEEAGVPKEDARFVLPYSFRSNFYMTLNARELVRLISEMLFGRAAHVSELRNLGEQLAAQMERNYPGVLEAESKRVPECAAKSVSAAIEDPHAATGKARLLSLGDDPAGSLAEAMAFSGRFEPVDGEYVCDRNMLKLARDARPRELEFISARFRVEDVSLASVTHFTRHRVLSLLTPDVSRGLTGGAYVVPDSIRKSPELLEQYEQAFAEQKNLAERLLGMGMDERQLGYLALAGHMVDLLLEMNGRELLHFLKLRTCNRAQWEIRALARQMLDQLRGKYEEIFWVYGPSCLVEGRCPEGKLSCGHPVTR